MEETMMVLIAAGCRIPRPGRIRVFPAYELNLVLGRMAPRQRRRCRRRIAGAAIAAMMVLKRGFEITCHPFEGAGFQLVLAARWTEARRTLTIEVELLPPGARLPTLAGAPVPRFRRRE
jgi:hypothetical protein